MTNDYIFYPLYVHQALSSLLLGQIAAATGTFIFTSLLYFNYQIKLLGYRISNCGFNCNLSDTNKYKEFVECIELHTEVQE